MLMVGTRTWIESPPPESEDEAYAGEQPVEADVASGNDQDLRLRLLRDRIRRIRVLGELQVIDHVGSRGELITDGHPEWSVVDISSRLPISELI